MTRMYNKRKEEANFTKEDMAKAIAAVKDKEMSLKKAAEIFGVKHTALFYQLKKQSVQEIFSSKYICTMDQEVMLLNYALKCSRLQYGLPYSDLRVIMQKVFVEGINWDINKMAGLDWFMRRHKNLSLRKPEDTSLARISAFNERAVNGFQENLQHALQKHKFTANAILNLDDGHNNCR